MGNFDKKTFAQLLLTAKGDRSLNQFALSCGISSAHLSRLTRELLDTPPIPETIKKIADKAYNGVSYFDLMKAAGHLQSRDSIIDLPFVYYKDFEDFMEEYFPHLIKYFTDNKDSITQTEYNIYKKIPEIIQGKVSFDRMDSWQRQKLVMLLFEIEDYSKPILIPNINLPKEILNKIPNTRFIKNNSRNSLPISKNVLVKIPVLGEIVAGLPIEAHQDIIEYEEIPIDLASNGEYFALKVKGDSMEPRIKEGDILIIRRQSDIDSGDIAVVLINGEEATVKQIHKADTGITLQPWNPAYQTNFFTNKEIETFPITILGKVVELRGKI